MLWLWLFLPFVDAPYVEKEQKYTLVPPQRHLVPMKRHLINHLVPMKRCFSHKAIPFWRMESY